MLDRTSIRPVYGEGTAHAHRRDHPRRIGRPGRAAAGGEVPRLARSDPRGEGLRVRLGDPLLLRRTGRGQLRGPGRRADPLGDPQRPRPRPGRGLRGRADRTGRPGRGERAAGGGLLRLRQRRRRARPVHRLGRRQSVYVHELRAVGRPPGVRELRAARPQGGLPRRGHRAGALERAGQHPRAPSPRRPRRTRPSPPGPSRRPSASRPISSASPRASTRSCTARTPPPAAR